MKLPEIKENFSNDSHLKFEHVKKRCASTDNICKSNNVIVCGIRIVDGETQHKDFKNSCYMFMSNMCKYPGQEFYIVSSGTCEKYLDSRRNSADKLLPVKNITLNVTDNKQSLRSSKFSTLYDIDSAFDYHPCPLSCPETYAPVCVSVNRGFGKYFKFYTFVNHCSGDLYYCKHWQEFSPPPNEDENVVSSNLGWSFCGSSRYLQFARFSEVSSSMGHYGWLAGNYKYSHIMEPHERMEGYGK
ncbi:uncharacterized protein LOC106708897 [Papilio machaon]|uniref:uncharacterized protein LOC106708897 n=1 Tax=Papilio machaon TaxID=76193 RepID=UPI001E66525F|nr:uncharacterized protein LOC106708897 [Papilio machaon]